MDTPEVEAFAGLEATVNDPFLVRRGLRGGVALRPLPWAGVVASIGAYPALGTLDWTPLTKELVEGNELAPNVSRVLGQGTVLAELTPLRTPSEPVSAALHVALGAGVVTTLDDLELAQLESSIAGQRHARETHPTVAWSVAADALFGRFGVRFRYSETRYREDVAGVAFRRWPIWLGVDVVVPLVAAVRDP